MTTVYLIRHAEAEGNLYRRAHGHYDSTITDRGCQQIAALAKRFAKEPIDAVYSSDLLRARTTALAVTLTHDLPLHTTDQLREVGIGEWEDKTWTWLSKFDMQRLVTFNTDGGSWHVEGGQDMADVRERMLRTLREIIDAHPDQTVAVFGHGMALRLLIGALEGLSIAETDETPHGENTAVTKLEADENGVRVVYRDDDSHLPDKLTTLRKQLWTRTEGGIEPGIWFLADPDTEGCFDVMRDDECIGGVGIGPCENGVAEIREFWLDEEEQGAGFGIRLLGQAISYARSKECDTLRITMPRRNQLGLRRAMAYGFAPVQGLARQMTLEKYFGVDEERQMAALKKYMK